MLQIGDQLDQYVIQSHLAQGGMSDIYRARDLMSGRQVVIKIPSSSLIGDPSQYERFRRELQVMGTLRHPAVQRGLGSGRFNRTPYLVTEWIDGHSMRQIVSEQAPMPAEQAVSLVIGIAEGLDYCHRNGVVHRDLKPENILVQENGQPVILDFGIALVEGASRITYANLTATSGTPDYMAPEQVEGQRGDERTDIYALGTILFELLTGSPPFSGDSSLAVMAQHLRGNAPRVDSVRADVPPALAAVVARCLQREPENRYRSMRAVVDDLRNLDAVDLAILDEMNTETTMAPFWHSQTMVAIGISLLVLVGIILLAIGLQALRRIGT